ncbi:MAG: hypothetical protein ACKVP0_13370 [Pirellulaceae bacterium]
MALTRSASEEEVPPSRGSGDRIPAHGAAVGKQARAPKAPAGAKEPWHRYNVSLGVTPANTVRGGSSPHPNSMLLSPLPGLLARVPAYPRLRRGLGSDTAAAVKGRDFWRLPNR